MAPGQLLSQQPTRDEMTSFLFFVVQSKHGAENETAIISKTNICIYMAC